MLNQAARYYPIARVLREHGLLKSESVLEIGSGPVGLGQFRKVPFIGCDLLFPFSPRPPLRPVIASGHTLPFPDKSFDAVIASDVLEHVPPSARESVILEGLRVTRFLAIFGFPCGVKAEECDRNLLKIYRRKQLDPPIWLKEHMLAAFPEAAIIGDMPGWDIVSFGNENIKFHSWMMRMELYRYFNYAMKGWMLFIPKLLELVLCQMDSPPYYRQIFVLTRLTP